MLSKYNDLKQSIINAVRINVEGKDIGVAFSGGLDSGLVTAISKDYTKSIYLYTCGTQDSYDVVMAKDLANRLDIPWKHIQISKSNIEKYVYDIISITGVSDPLTISYELQLFSVCKESNEDIILTGQGSDEYFMGCAKFVGQSIKDYEILRSASINRLIGISLPCENLIANYFNKRLIYPYLDPVVISEIQKINPEELRPKDMDSRKQVLRDIAMELGYYTIANRRKKSSQYGSGTTNLIRSVAHDNNMMYSDYIYHIYKTVGKTTTK